MGHSSRAARSGRTFRQSFPVAAFPAPPHTSVLLSHPSFFCIRAPSWVISPQNYRAHHARSNSPSPPCPAVEPLRPGRVVRPPHEREHPCPSSCSPISKPPFSDKALYLLLIDTGLGTVEAAVGCCLLARTHVVAWSPRSWRRVLHSQIGCYIVEHLPGS